MSVTELKIKGGAIIKSVPEPKKKLKKFPGYRLFGDKELFTGAIVAGSMSGKTYLIRDIILNHLADKRKKDKHKFFIYSSTVHRDPKYKEIIDELSKRKFEVTYDNEYDGFQSHFNKITVNDYHYPFTKYIFIGDDMGDDNRKPIITQLSKAGRHSFLSLVAIHDPTDLTPPARKNIHIWMLLRNLPLSVLEKVYAAIKPPIEFVDFKKLYDYTQSKGKYNFLYYDKISNIFKMNFDKELHV